MAKKELNILRTPIFRLNYPNLFELATNKDGTNPKYGCTAIWDPNKFSPQDKKRWRAIKDELNSVCQLKFKESWDDLPGNYKTGIRSGREKKGDATIQPHMFFASLTSKKIRPTVVLAQKDDDGKWIKVGPEYGNADVIYSGCYCIATINIYTFDNQGKGVGLGLMKLQKIADGPRIEYGRSAEEDFDDDVLDEYDGFDTSDDGGDDLDDDL